MSTTTIQTIQEAIATEKEWIIHLRRHFHQYPEASLKEYETIKRIKEELLALAIPFVEVGETGVLATIEGGLGAGKTILLRADIDALELPDATGAAYASKNPGLNHACGHDGHAAALLGAAKVLKKHQDTFSGTIKLAFQPAEEIGAGGSTICGRKLFRSNRPSVWDSFRFQCAGRKISRYQRRHQRLL